MARKTKYNRITTPEKLAQINKNNKDLHRDFLDYLKSTHKSEGTIKGYDSDLNIFWVWVLDNLDNKNFQDITKRELVRFQNWLVEDNENSPARVRRIKAAISSLSNYIEAILDEEDEFKDFRSIVRKIESPTLQPVRERTVWKEDELLALLSILAEKGKIEQECFVALGMYSGRRKAELLRFKVSDFTQDHLVCDNALYKSAPILTKGGKMLECYTLAKRFQPHLDKWLKYREEHCIESEWLFPDPSDHTKQRSIGSVNGWTITFSKYAEKDFYVHSLRSYYVSALLRAGIPDNVVVEIIGWSSAEMVKVYDDNPKEQKIAVYFKDGDIFIPESKGIGDI